jgi:hypothetical protein
VDEVHQDTTEGGALEASEYLWVLIEDEAEDLETGM